MLSRSCLFRLEDFFYNLGDCLFDAFVVLCHFQFTSIQIREGIVKHFNKCLDNRDLEALRSLKTDLNIDFLKDLHGIDNSQTYLKRMSFSACFDSHGNPSGLWGDPFCIKWFANWLSIPIRVWSFARKKIDLHFNEKISGYQYNILYHDQNDSIEHYEPILSQLCQFTIHPTMPLRSLSICQLKPLNMQTHYESIHNALSRKQLLRCKAPSYDCHDSLFESICFLLGEYDMMSLRKCASQTF